MRIPIAKEGFIFIIPPAVAGAGLCAAGWHILASVCLLLFLFVTWFFRDPERAIPPGLQAIVSPADGKVVEIVRETDPFMGKIFTRVSIFLSVFNVHINRLPIAGKIEKIHYNPGKFLAAYDHKASLDNEQNTVMVKQGEVRILVKQIAGLIARRIICWVKEGDCCESGQRFGLIRFGSRVDIFIPETARLEVKVGDRVRGGSSIIGHLT